MVSQRSRPHLLGEQIHDRLPPRCREPADVRACGDPEWSGSWSATATRSRQRHRGHGWLEA